MFLPGTTFLANFFSILIVISPLSSKTENANHHYLRPQAAHLLQMQQQQQQDKDSISGSLEESVFLESMEDLEHIAYLSMRNFNITDDGLLQSSWLIGLGNALNHKSQHQKVASMTQSTLSEDVKGRLSLMLETFIAHLRNGHLHRMSLSDLKSIVLNLNSTYGATNSDEGSGEAIQPPTGNNGIAANENNNNETNTLPLPQDSNQLLKFNDGRCDYLVTIYKYELIERQRVDYQKRQQQQLLLLQSHIEYEQQQQQQQQPTPSLVANDATVDINNTNQTNEFEDFSNNIDTNRLNRLCQLVIECNSAEQLVGLISGPWKQQLTTVGQNQQLKAKKQRRRRSHQLSSSLDEEQVSMIDIQNREDQRQPSTTKTTKTLRDSLSLSLAKLCPLILFQLHDDDEICSVRKEDRPPMITVWGFATLFVTIVSFCSLIGLSITPLLGSTGKSSASPDSSANNRGDLQSSSSSSSSSTSSSSSSSSTSSSSSSSSATRSSKTTTIKNDVNSPSISNTGMFHLHQKHQPLNDHHKACLTLFEGLAVGSLVGSALFSLIPQAFELQERESNQGFLLKALIIFFGIYLFFLSERIMRIILDTRQRRKKQKLRILNHRSSNSMALPSTLVDGFAEQPLQTNNHRQTTEHQLKSMPTRRQLMQQQQRRSMQTDVGSLLVLPTNGRKNLNNNNSSGRLQSQNVNSTTTTNLMLKKPSKRTEESRLRSSRNQPLQVSSSAAVDQQQQMDGTFDQHIEMSACNQVPAAAANQPGLTPPQVQKAVNFKQAARNGRKSLNRNPLVDDGYVCNKQVNNKAALRSTSAGGAAGGSASNIPEKRSRRRKTRHQLRLMRQQQRRSRHQLQLLQQLPARDSESDAETSQLRRKQQPSSSSSSSSCLLSSNAQRDDFLSVDESNAYMSASNNDDDGVACFNNKSINEFNIDSSDWSDDDEEGNKFKQMRAVSEQISYRYSINRNRLMNEREKIMIMQQHDQDDDDNCHHHHHHQQQQHQHQHRTTTFQLPNNLPTLPAANENCYHHRSQTPIRQQAPYNNNNNNNNNNNYKDSNYVIKQDISTVAWMIVLGDGLHNFIDGISIGAAFSESILSGVSISVAVICEEFPHELGDFAVLVSSGMTVRQALGYNFLSACTCYFGMAVGIILGDVNDGASYISALAAGVFLYIALVDMMGELSATLEETSRDSITRTLKLLLLQNVGIFIGISIIFILSFIDF